MKRILWLIVGLGLGAVLAHLLSRTEFGQRTFAGINGTLDEFSQGIRDGYQEREAELRAAMGEPAPAESHTND